MAQKTSYNEAQKHKIAHPRPPLNLLKALWGGHTAALQFLIGHRPLMCEEEHAIDDRRLLAAIIMKYLFREGKVLCFATRRGTFFTNDDKSKSET